MRILFVDDNQDTRDLFAFFFRLSGHSTRLAQDGVEAVTSVESDYYDMIVLNVRMPHMDGWEALKRIRRLPNGNAVPIALFSASIQSDQIEEAKRRGANIVLLKPLVPEAMLSVINDLTTNHQNN